MLLRPYLNSELLRAEADVAPSVEMADPIALEYGRFIRHSSAAAALPIPFSNTFSSPCQLFLQYLSNPLLSLVGLQFLNMNC